MLDENSQHCLYRASLNLQTWGVRSSEIIVLIAMFASFMNKKNKKQVCEEKAKRTWLSVSSLIFFGRGNMLELLNVIKRNGG